MYILSQENSPANSDWELSWGPRFEELPTLQEDISRGDRWEREQVPWCVRVGVKSCPVLLHAILWDLRGKASALTTMAAVTRFVGRCGIRVIQKLPAIHRLERDRKKAFKAVDELALLKFSRGHYDFGFRLGINTVYLNTSFFQWVHAKTCDLLPIMGLDLSTLAMVVLVHGLAQDEGWLPKMYFDKICQEIDHFNDYLLARLEGNNQ
ncbi:hypothetical protein SDD30_10435 [Moorella naiadis]|uniref:hypothetical protein n=1 Tax=Moorella naiadis (nom. illeg.) TaxID=3093670 RepID=UPI003D9CB026